MHEHYIVTTELLNKKEEAEAPSEGVSRHQKPDSASAIRTHQKVRQSRFRTKIDATSGQTVRRQRTVQQ